MNYIGVVVRPLAAVRIEQAWQRQHSSITIAGLAVLQISVVLVVIVVYLVQPCCLGTMFD